MTVALFLLDLTLALGAALRLTRFVVADDLPGLWWIKDPLWRATAKHATDAQTAAYGTTGDPAHLGWRGKILAGLGCPFCFSVWVSGAVTISLALVGGPGDASDYWRYGAGFLALAWLTGHIAALTGDTED